MSDKRKMDHTDVVKDAGHLRMCKALSLAIAYSANVGGIGSLTGTGPNVVMKGQSDMYVFAGFSNYLSTKM